MHIISIYLLIIIYYPILLILNYKIIYILYTYKLDVFVIISNNNN